MFEKTITSLLICFSCVLSAEVLPQAGVESYMGANGMLSISPWIGERFGLNANASLILKVRQTFLGYNYIDYDPETDITMEKRNQTKITQITAALFMEKGKWSTYQAASILWNKESYLALVIDAGFSFRAFHWLKLEGGLYMQGEDSSLWFPDEPRRRIDLASIRAGMRILIWKWLSLHPQAFGYRNSDKVTAYSYSFGLEITPRYPYSASLNYIRYSESDQYRFSGNYFSVSFNLYF